MTELRKRKNTKILKSKEKNTQSESDESCETSFSASNGTICGNVGKFLLFVVFVPPMLNYASLRQERDFLTANTTLYDVGFEQKLYLQCEGEGSPTVLLDAPTGLTSDSWAPGNAHLQGGLSPTEIRSSIESCPDFLSICPNILLNSSKQHFCQSVTLGDLVFILYIT